jgi:phage gp36-like protein
MAFLNKSDLYVTILEDELNEITRSDDTLITAACSAALAEMKVYLNDSYDVDTIFTRTGTARHALLLNLGADMAVYFIVARCQAGQALDDRKSRYDRAVKSLKAFQKSETYADLPRRAATVQKQVSFKSNPKRGNYF